MNSEQYVSSGKSTSRPVYLPISHEVVSAEKFADLIKNHRSKIKRYKIQTPKFDDLHAPFGQFIVEYVTPQLIPNFNNNLNYSEEQ